MHLGQVDPREAFLRTYLCVVCVGSGGTEVPRAEGGGAAAADGGVATARHRPQTSGRREEATDLGGGKRPQRGHSQEKPGQYDIEMYHTVIEENTNLRNRKTSLNLVFLLFVGIIDVQLSSFLFILTLIRSVLWLIWMVLAKTQLL